MLPEMIRSCKALIAISMTLFCASLASGQTNVSTAQIHNDLLSPTAFYFGPEIKTVGQAVNQVLTVTHFRLNSHLPESIINRFRSPLPMQDRVMGITTVSKALKRLTLSDVYLITPTTHTLGFSKNKSLSHIDLVKPVVKETDLERFLERTNFKIRIASVLPIKSKTKDLSTAVIAYNKQHKLYFGFNDRDTIVSIAPTQRQANALCKEPREVFYAIAGQSLKATITRWAGFAHTKVFWLAHEDLVLQTSSVFFGSLKAKEGSLSDLLTAANASGIFLKASFTSNNALIIKHKRYSTLFLLPGGNHA